MLGERTMNPTVMPQRSRACLEEPREPKDLKRGLKRLWQEEQRLAEDVKYGCRCRHLTNAFRLEMGALLIVLHSEFDLSLMIAWKIVDFLVTLRRLRAIAKEVE